jgi:hypothetical protein
MDTLYRNYIIITSKDQDENDAKLKYNNKNNINDTAIVYCYKCKIESFKDVIDASKIMLTNNIKVLKTVNNSKINEWELYTFSKIDELKTILRKNSDNLNLMISTLKLKDDFI